MRDPSRRGVTTVLFVCLIKRPEREREGDSIHYSCVARIELARRFYLRRIRVHDSSVVVHVRAVKFSNCVSGRVRARRDQWHGTARKTIDQLFSSSSPGVPPWPCFVSCAPGRGSAHSETRGKLIRRRPTASRRRYEAHAFR